MKSLSLVPALRIEIRDVGKTDWQVYELAHSDNQALTRADRFKQQQVEGVEMRIVANVAGEQVPASIKGHPEYVELSNFKDDVIAMTGTDDLKMLRELKQTSDTAKQIHAAHISEIADLRNKLAAPIASDAEKPVVPFVYGQLLLDVHTGNVVRVIEVSSEGFRYQFGHETGFCPIASCDCYVDNATAEALDAGAIAEAKKSGVEIPAAGSAENGAAQSPSTSIETGSTGSKTGQTVVTHFPIEVDFTPVPEKPTVAVSTSAKPNSGVRRVRPPKKKAVGIFAAAAKKKSVARAKARRK